MRILVLGANGMLGHVACRVLTRAHQVFATCRDAHRCHPALAALLSPDRLFAGYSAGDESRLQRILEASRPAVVLNCIGIVKQKADAQLAIPSIRVNALFPHQLAEACVHHGARLIQVSTDCVFSGLRGRYREDDIPDPVDLYGRSKLLGEVVFSPHLTIRTSIIGRELASLSNAPTAGLLEWLLAHRGASVRGYARAIFSGLTTQALADLLLQLLECRPLLAGLYHLAAEPIDKFDLLCRINHALALDVSIARDEEFICDRSLDGSKFLRETGLSIPNWDEMIEALKLEGVDDRSGGGHGGTG